MLMNWKGHTRSQWRRSKITARNECASGLSLIHIYLNMSIILYHFAPNTSGECCASFQLNGLLPSGNELRVSESCKMKDARTKLDSLPHYILLERLIRFSCTFSMFDQSRLKVIFIHDISKRSKQGHIKWIRSKSKD